MRVTSLVALPFVAAALVGGSVGVASAANTQDNAQGRVEMGPDHANSICSFSGLNDVPLDPEEGGRVQSFGQIVRQIGVAPLKAEDEFPGVLCNGHLFPYPEGFGPPPAP
jgi:hypothetical protein